MARIRCLLLAALFAPPAVSAPPEIPPLRYAMKAGQQYAYQVKIEADLGDVIQSREGVLTFAPSSVTERQIQFRQTGTLVERTRPKPGVVVRPSVPRVPPFPAFPTLRAGGPVGTTINVRGEVVTSAETNQLPFLLGRQELLVFEEFPDEAKPAWERTRDIVIREKVQRAMPGGFLPRRPIGGPFGRPAEDDFVERAAVETYAYVVTDVTDAAVTIDKSYDLESGEKDGDEPRVKMTGEGELVFDRERGVFRSQEIKYTIRQTEANVTRKIPLKVSYRLMSAEELADLNAKQAELRAKAEAEMAERNRPKPFEPGERARLLDDLASKDSRRMKAAAERLVKVPPEGDTAEIAAALAPLLDESDVFLARSAIQAMGVWPGPAAEAALIRASASENVFLRGPAVEALGDFPGEKTAEAAAAQAYRNRGESAKALRAMGAVAESAVIGLLTDRDAGVRREAGQILAEIGGAKALEALKGYEARAEGFEKGDARRAVETLEKKLAGPN